ncbi:UvrD-helicase domain-containing protein [Paenibacillus lautus]|uniref:DNA 3'-5' helicase n=1 Tax=Paenibacillus lautus TaxID=1401 RepID=A0A385TRB4_PAELA|nr:UvrD-helicase domain-containing protein [Paenibacillus lautus]AYB46266.1 ATP-dependent DNA helicase PcrA [Paenibacillus lautus]
MPIRGGYSVTSEQERIIDHVVAKRVTVVSAGAGSGKTYTMIATVMELIEMQPDTVRLDDFVLITFTNKAADEMRERLEKAVTEKMTKAQGQGLDNEYERWMVQKERITSTFIGTIHAFCSKLLRAFGYEERVAHEAEVLMARRYYQEALDQTLLESLQTPDEVFLFRETGLAPYELKKMVTSWYERLRGRGRQPKIVLEETLRQPHDGNNHYRVAVARMLERLHRNYERVKQERGGVDSNDLLSKTVALLDKQKEHVNKLIGSLFRYIFVDEFQDTDRLQKQIIQSLEPYVLKVLMVGDRKQSVYEFRGAEESILQEMAIEMKVDLLLLSISRRPTATLLEAQNALFQNMGTRYPVLKDLLSNPPDARYPTDRMVPFRYMHVTGDPRDMQSRIDLTKSIVRRYLRQEIDRSGLRKVRLNDICLIFRTNEALQAYATAFQGEFSIQLDNEKGFFQKPEIVGIYYLLQAIVKYPNDVTVALLQNSPYLPFTSPFVTHTKNPAIHPLWDWLRQDTKAKDWYAGMMEIRHRAKSELVPPLLVRILEFTKVREYYAGKGNLQAIANIEKLLSWSRDLMHAEALTLHQFVERLQIAFLTDESMEEAKIGESSVDAIRFSTVHAAKGLEYPIVIIPEMQRPISNTEYSPEFFDIREFGIDLALEGSNRSIIGSSDLYNQWLAQYNENLRKEEARIFYVGVTRAENVICLIGGGYNPSKINQKYWSWKDEVVSAASELTSLGESKVVLSL